MSLYETLYPWQKSIVDKFKDRQAYGLFLDMGLGKTLVSLAFTEVNNCDRVLVISINAKACESETIPGSWLNWISKSNIKYDILTKWSSVEDVTTSNQMLLINYESLFERGKNKKEAVTLKHIINEFIVKSKGKRLAIIVDESHKMKNIQSQQTKAIMKIQKLANMYADVAYTYLLTGTPFTTGYIDLYTQLKALGCNQTKARFVEDYCVRGHIPGLYDWQQPIVGYRNIDQLYRLIHEYALTIKSEDIVDLPDKIFVDHPLNESTDFRMYMNEKIKSAEIKKYVKTNKLDVDVSQYSKDIKYNNPFYRNIAFPELKWIADTNGTYWLRARQLSIGFQGNAEEAQWFNRNRLNALEEFLTNNINNYVIFYNFTPELTEIYDICVKLGYNVDFYCGEIKSLDNYEKYCNMNESEKLTNKNNVILANFASGSTGMNWQEYNNCVIFSTPLYKDYAQALKRVHRLGQKNTVVYHVFYENNWLDGSMRKALDTAEDYSLKMFEADLERIKNLTSD